MTQSWVGENAYCPACASEHLEPTTEGTPVVDFICSKCKTDFQLKSQSKPFSARIVDGAYRPMIDSILEGKAPNFLLMKYNIEKLSVNDFFAIPKHFLFPEVIEKRKPLSDSARRAGWVGCNILLNRLPEEGKVSILKNGMEIDKSEVRKKWQSFKILSDVKPKSRGWTADVLSCVRKLEKPQFKLSDAYSFELELSKLHPDNKNVLPKIRQQLQILRDLGVLEFLGNGNYRILR
jgi:type II restriction enzyme